MRAKRARWRGRAMLRMRPSHHPSRYRAADGPPSPQRGPHDASVVGCPARGGMKKTFVPLFDIFGSVRTGARRPLPDFFLPKSETSDFGRGEASFCFVTPPSASLPSLNRR
jgi:hypothetical protein